jgi:hypothetical protein
MRGRAGEAEFVTRTIGADERANLGGNRPSAELTIILRNPTRLKPKDVCGLCTFWAPNRTKVFHVKHFGTIARSLLPKICVQNRRINLCQTREFRDRDMLVHHMRGRANAAEFEDGAIGLNETRIRRAAAR